MLIDSPQAGRKIYHKTMNLPNVSQKKKKQWICRKQSEFSDSKVL